MQTRRFLAFLLFSGFLVLSTLAQASQFTFFSGTWTWEKDTWKYHTQLGPAGWNWKSPANYHNGPIYIRYEAIDKPSNKQVALQLCVWQDGFALESCGRALLYSQKGVYYVKMGAPSTWWNKPGGAIDWTRKMGQIVFQHKNESYNNRPLKTQGCGSFCYQGTDIDTHVPIVYKSTAIGVSYGGTFTPPPEWQGCPASWGCGSGASITTIEAESMTLNGYIVDNGQHLNGTGITVDPNGSGTGTATTNFTGQSGSYTIRLSAIPENDGTPTIKLYVGGNLILTET